MRVNKGRAIVAYDHQLYGHNLRFTIMQLGKDASSSFCIIMVVSSFNFHGRERSNRACDKAISIDRTCKL